jgi:Rhs element Vgr protein
MPNSSSIPAPEAAGVVSTTILVEGVQISDTIQILSIVVGKEANRIPTATITLADGEASKQTFDISNQQHFVPGKKVEIKLGYSSQEDTVFKGIVTAQRLKLRQSGSFLTVECKDEAVKMTLDRKSKYFREQKDSDVMEELVGNYGLSSDVEATSLQHKELVQFDSTDWDFLLTRCEANGLFCFANDGKVKIAKPEAGSSPVLSIAYGTTILELDVEMDARHQFKAVKSTAWSHAEQAVVEAESNEPALSNPGNLSYNELADAVQVETFMQRHSGKVSEPELKGWADARLMRQRLAKTCGRAKFQGFAGIAPGDVLEIEKLADRFEGKVWVSAVRHEVADGNWLTDVQFGLRPTWFFEKQDIRPPAAGGLLPPVNGLQIGIVTKLEDDPDGEDRIQVRLPLISPDDEGIWARVATLDAGENRGSFFRPELNDEVLVGFLNDDPRHPVVLGMFNSSAKPAPHQPKDDNHEKGFVTRSEMKVWFDDDKKIMTLSTPAGNKLELNEDEKAIKLEDQHGNKITMDQDGIKIESTKDIVLKATADIKAEGVNIEQKASASLKAEGSASASFKGNGSMTVESGGVTTVKGAMVQIN